VSRLGTRRRDSCLRSRLECRAAPEHSHELARQVKQRAAADNDLGRLLSGREMGDIGWGTRRFGVRGKRSATPLWLRSTWGSGPPKRRRRCALPAHSKGPACHLSSRLLGKLRARLVSNRSGNGTQKSRGRSQSVSACGHAAEWDTPRSHENGPRLVPSRSAQAAKPLRNGPRQ